MGWCTACNEYVIANLDQRGQSLIRYLHLRCFVGADDLHCSMVVALDYIAVNNAYDLSANLIGRRRNLFDVVLPTIPEPFLRLACSVCTAVVKFKSGGAKTNR
jgi:hypothetical protein